jgi:hypothetical protein
MDIKDLELKQGLIFSLIWVMIELILGNSSFWDALMSGIRFMILWVLVSIILILLCNNYNWCL